MEVAEMADKYLSGNLQDIVPTDADRGFSASWGKDNPNQLQWENIIEHRLKEWKRFPQRYEDIDADPPNPIAVDAGIRLANALIYRHYPAPTHVLLDPDGGVVFENRGDQFTAVFHVWDDGEIEYQFFEGATLLDNYLIDV